MENKLISLSDTSTRELILKAESMFRCNPYYLREMFWIRREDETITLSESLKSQVNLPDKVTFTEMVNGYRVSLKASPNHLGTKGYGTFTCCETHLALRYLDMLITAIANAYPVTSKGQVLSQQWWIDFTIGG